MATEALEEKKPEEEAAPVEDKEEVKGEKEVEESKGTKEEEEDDEVEKAKENKDEEGAKKAKGSSRKRSSRKEPTKTKKSSRESSANKKASQDLAEKKEHVTPSSNMPTRERKVVERYSAPSVARSSSGKPLSIEKVVVRDLKIFQMGFNPVVVIIFESFFMFIQLYVVTVKSSVVGCTVFIWYLTLKFLLDDREGLKSCGLAFKLSKRKPDDNLQMLHMILFGKKAKPHSLKRNISQFSGFVWIDNEEEASAKLLEFLESPHATTDILLAEKEQKGKKCRGTPSKCMSPGEAADTSAKLSLWTTCRNVRVRVPNPTAERLKRK
ncbi:Protein DEK [Corchorus capsularis]|uniref:Protein DEK n=1 Tax=Corchorus capsularis TaxID=210143 RepID=A0A1R3JSQ9_COCAP|nr:Protein DEK [Corchorus capsularis]